MGAGSARAYFTQLVCWGLFMRYLIAAIAAAVSVVALAQAASAADMPVKAPVNKAPYAVPYNWSGFYVGGHVGYLWGRTRVEEDGVVTDDGAPTNGVIGGVLAGYNWQTGQIVLGLEGDFGWTHADGTGAVLPPPPPVVVLETPNTYRINWTSHVHGRLGYAVNNWLPFIAGGLAIADFDFHEGGDVSVPVVGAKYVGWSIGGGFDYAFTRNFIARVEYLYDDFGHKNYTGSDGDPYRVSLKSQTLRGALIWKFDPSGMP
jgi:outer membrane immunogenic protein